MLEKLTNPDYKLIAHANSTVINYIQEIKKHNNNPIYYEIGIGIGATTLAVAESMCNKGNIYIFSYEKDCMALKNDLNRLGYTNIISTFCSENKTYSGYHFDMAMAVLDNKLPNFDLCYLDGGHVFHLDAPTTCMIKELCKINGYIIFDDYDWSLEKSPTFNPKKRPQTLKEYDTKQIQICHIQMICSLFMDIDKRYQNIEIESKRYKIYKRVG